MPVVSGGVSALPLEKSEMHRLICSHNHEKSYQTRRKTTMSGNSLSITDNRTGKQYEVQIENGTIRAMDLRQIKVGDDDFGLMTYDPAFMNLSLIHISEPTRLLSISYAVFCLKKKKKQTLI